MRIVLDTNVLVSAVLTDGPARRVLRSCIDGPHTMLASPTTLQEFAEVISRPKFRQSDEDVRVFVALLLQTVELLEPRSQLAIIAKDPDDDRFLELALDGHADAIVSGDPHLTELTLFRGIPIWTVAKAIAQLGV